MLPTFDDMLKDVESGAYDARALAPKGVALPMVAIIAPSTGMDHEYACHGEAVQVSVLLALHLSSSSTAMVVHLS